MTIPVYNQKGQDVGKVRLRPEVFDVKINSVLVHQVAVSMMANARGPYAHVKTRGEVSGGGKKPWRQKGTGRARHGSIRSPLWVGGGVTFGPRNDRNFKKKINKKVKTKAILMCLTDKAKSEKLIVLDNLKLDIPKTKFFFKFAKNYQ